MTAYRVGLVGEQHYQDDIRQARLQSFAIIVHEYDNPYDPNALAVWDEHGHRLGYVPRDCFLRRAVFDEEQKVLALVEAITPGQRGFFQVVLQVVLIIQDWPAFAVNRHSREASNGPAGLVWTEVEPSGEARAAGVIAVRNVEIGNAEGDFLPVSITNKDQAKVDQAALESFSKLKVLYDERTATLLTQFALCDEPGKAEVIATALRLALPNIIKTRHG